ncbi:MAG: ankyrin repeat domain-containing protein [Betaproteobacteria bacterium]|nr:MAG: ankyrin repeat domain-containing protein [Betaproteobacteria bacterium]
MAFGPRGQGCGALARVRRRRAPAGPRLRGPGGCPRSAAEATRTGDRPGPGRHARRSAPKAGPRPRVQRVRPYPEVPDRRAGHRQAPRPGMARFCEGNGPPPPSFPPSTEPEALLCADASGASRDLKSVMRLVLQLIVITWIFVAHAQSSMDDFLEAVERGDSQKVASYLDRGMDVDTTDAHGQTIAMIAARTGRTELLSMLISRKANIHRQTPTGDTALMIASLSGQYDAVRVLIDAGAQVDRRPGWTPLHYAAFGGSPKVVGYLLVRGANRNALAPNGYTPLMLAARNGNIDAAKVLLSNNPELNRRGPIGETALGIAIKRGEPEMIELLRRAGAQP